MTTTALWPLYIAFVTLRDRSLPVGENKGRMGIVTATKPADLNDDARGLGPSSADTRPSAPDGGPLADREPGRMDSFGDRADCRPYRNKDF